MLRNSNGRSCKKTLPRGHHDPDLKIVPGIGSSVTESSIKPRYIFIRSCLIAAFLASSLWLALPAEAAAPPRFLALDELRYSLTGGLPFQSTTDAQLGKSFSKDGWQPLAQFNENELAGCDHFWVGIPLPAGEWNEPAVYLSAFLDGFEVFFNNEKIHQYGRGHETQADKNDYEYDHPHILPLPPDYPQAILRIKIHFRNPAAVGSILSIAVGSRPDLEDVLVQEQQEKFMDRIQEMFFGFLLVITGTAAMFVFIIRLRMREYAFLAFGLFAVTAGAKYLAAFPLPSFWNLSPSACLYIEHLLFWLVPVGLFAFIETVFGAGPYHMVRRLWQFHLILAAVFCLLITRHSRALYLLSLVLLAFNCSLCLAFILGRQVTATDKIKLPFAAFMLLFILLLSNELLMVLNLVPWSYDLFGWGILGLVLALGYVLIAHYTQTFQQMQQVSLELEKNKTRILELQQAHLQARFEALKSQLNPHFLFNNLSTLVAIIENDPRQAVAFVQNLSGIYRYVLQMRSEELVTLNTELDFAKSYEFLLAKRFGTNFSLAVTIPAALLSHTLPPLTLQLLIENAVKHNVISSKSPLTIEIFSEADYIIVRNKLQPKNLPETSTQVGLANICNRFSYFTERQVEISTTAGRFQVKLPLLRPFTEREK